MRWLAIAALLVLSSVGVNATELAPAENPATETSVQIPGADGGVVVTAIPSHSMAAELVKELKPGTEMRSARKARAAQKISLAKSMLSRTERHQMALLVSKPMAGGPSLLDLLNDDDADSSAGDIDLQRFYSRPKVVKVADQDEAESDLPDVVKLRLFLARMQAIRAHQKKFG